MFRDTTQARKLLRYLAGAEAQGIWVKLGGKLSPNSQTPVSAYPDMLSKEGAQVVVNITIGRYGATDGMPSVMRTAAWQAILAYVKNQAGLTSILVNLDKVQQTAYASS
jgi:alpha-glucoside transport system substrate-binding protein